MTIPMDEAERRLPVAVITGFLGSGKTTLINRLLRHPRMADAAVNGGNTLDAQSEAVKQAAIADRLLITKTDLAAPDTVTELHHRLRALNPGATLLTVASGDVDPTELFDRGCFDAQTKTVEVQS